MRPTNNLAQLVPLAIGVAVVGGVTWLLLEGDSVLGTWLLAALILGHGLAHLAFVAPAPSVRATGRALTAVAVVTSLLAALATVGIVVPAEWWPGLVVALAVSSMLLLTLRFAPAFLVGFGIDAALLWLVFLSGWRPTG